VLQEEHGMVKEVMENANKLRVELENKPEFSQPAIDCLNTLSREKLQRSGVADRSSLIQEPTILYQNKV